MLYSLQEKGYRLTADDSEALSLAIPFDFDGPQPNHFGAPRGRRETLRLGGFVGDTKRGGSCNVDTLNLTPHCNGTHTETISHIVDEEIWIGHAIPQPLMSAALITIAPTPAAMTDESYRPTLDVEDRVVTMAMLRRALAAARLKTPTALIVRTKPNAESKRAMAYSADHPPAFFTVEAMEFIVDLDCRHLLVDLPSVDRMYDDGRLTNHHLFWNVSERSHRLSAESWQDKTITEMVYAPDSAPDGPYVLNLQIPAFCSDAAPSRPVIIPAKVEEQG